jgi:hypothetical protein
MGTSRCPSLNVVFGSPLLDVVLVCHVALLSMLTALKRF